MIGFVIFISYAGIKKARYVVVCNTHATFREKQRCPYLIIVNSLKNVHSRYVGDFTSLMEMIIARTSTVGNDAPNTITLISTLHSCTVYIRIRLAYTFVNAPNQKFISVHNDDQKWFPRVADTRQGTAHRSTIFDRFWCLLACQNAIIAASTGCYSQQHQQHIRLSAPILEYLYVIVGQCKLN